MLLTDILEVPNSEMMPQLNIARKDALTSPITGAYLKINEDDNKKVYIPLTETWLSFTSDGAVVYLIPSYKTDTNVIAVKKLSWDQEMKIVAYIIVTNWKKYMIVDMDNGEDK